jgi:hypothetical protein
VEGPGGEEIVPGDRQRGERHVYQGRPRGKLKKKKDAPFQREPSEKKTRQGLLKTFPKPRGHSPSFLPLSTRLPFKASFLPPYAEIEIIK